MSTDNQLNIIILVQKSGQLSDKANHIVCGIKNIFDKVANFLTSANIKVFGHTCLFSMLLLIGLALFYIPGVFV